MCLWKYSQFKILQLILHIRWENKASSLEQRHQPQFKFLNGESNIFWVKKYMLSSFLFLKHPGQISEKEVKTFRCNATNHKTKAQ